MNAMIFAAGKGTRLRPITDTMPKALVPVAGKPLLQHVIDKLTACGFDNIVVNTHHFAEQIVAYLHGTTIKISEERDELLETGGGLKKALPLFGNNEQVLIHNVDILSNVNLTEFYNQSQNNDATLLVSARDTKRYLIFNKGMRLIGWTNIETGEVKSPAPLPPKDDVKFFAFSGIHCVSPRIAELMKQWPERFPIMEFYLKHCGELNIKGVVKNDLQLMDVGKIDTISEAETFIKNI